MMLLCLQVGEADDNGTVTSDIDEFTSLLSADDARVLVDLLKLAVANRAGPRAKESLSQLLTALARFNPAVFTSG